MVDPCPYCDEDFGSENEKGVHISEEHVDSESKIPRKESNVARKFSILDEFDSETEGGWFGDA